MQKKKKERFDFMNLLLYQKLKNWSVYESICVTHALQEKAETLDCINLYCIHSGTLTCTNVISMSYFSHRISKILLHMSHCQSEFS